MHNVSKTMYIPLYGKAYVSQKGIILHDEKAEEIWSKEGFELKGKAASKWLAYYMGMRSRVFDEWTIHQMKKYPDAVILHLGCGLDSRAERIETEGHLWIDVDFETVIEERKKFFQETQQYRMVASDIRNASWLKDLEQKQAVVIMEGVSMYLSVEELKQLMKELNQLFDQVALLMDVYTVFAAKASRIKNPINEVGVREVTGFDQPKDLNETGLVYRAEHMLTPHELIEELQGFEKIFFKTMFAGSAAKKMYRLYEFCKN